MKINYDLEMTKLIHSLNHRPTLLLHSCCGPCSTACISRLKDYFDITIFYYNPCLYPNTEYEKRLSTQIDFINQINETLENKIKIIIPPYTPNEFFNKTKGLENEKEGGSRCRVCYADRIGATFDFALNSNFEYFGTTLSVSPYKHSDWLNEIGLKLQNEQCKYLVSDFKKQDGYKTSIILSRKYNLYRQNYCGCKYSYVDMLKFIESQRK